MTGSVRRVDAKYDVSSGSHVSTEDTAIQKLPKDLTLPIFRAIGIVQV